MTAETQRGEVIIEGDYSTLKYERRLAHPRDVVWKAITDPKELAMWFNSSRKYLNVPANSAPFAWPETILMIACLCSSLVLLVMNNCGGSAISFVNRLWPIKCSDKIKTI
jgi:hypothetical protein